MAPATTSTESSTTTQPSAPPHSTPGSAGNPDSVIPGIGLDRSQLLALIASLPPGIAKVGGGVEQHKGDLQQIINNVALQQAAQQQQQQQQQPRQQHQFIPAAFPSAGMSDPGPSTHPSGPPSSQHQPNSAAQEAEEDSDGESQSPPGKMPPITPSQTLGGRRSKNGAAMGSDEWTRQRKDNHKEVERRRRGNINEGINELGRIVPNGSGEKAKGAILSRAVQYIHHLKENEARNIEKWTLEKLLMDQAMGDLQAQLEEMRRMWEEERVARLRAENEAGKKRAHEDDGGKEEDNVKRQRTE
uniref:Helix-loop-helix domain protein MYC2-2 n=1 Tax=Flammulina velutipes TaxID=38945 RepID=A0A1B2U6Z0_FLAVE|nr:helix-loop-helix domain protein MYC2-2 [Flammulina velutipes]